MAVTEETLETGGSLKASNRKLDISKDRTYAPSDEQDSITHRTDEIIKVAQLFDPRLYASDIRPEETAEQVVRSACNLAKSNMAVRHSDAF